ncbi:hypothetical protein TrVE_jg2199 [Triparma verrucosa]|uniref:Uncharacterized protein n=1 Tax=Triparma verrucosa TaxID=1606542 RepID=A0A9W7KW16_9STRA|nr:hypothetical protein TrVE_jg2199 [Triparma verrucosa]
MTSNSAPLHIQLISTLTLIRVAKFSMSKRRRVVAILSIFTGISGLFLLSALGNSGKQNNIVDVVGGVGLGCALAGVLLEMSGLRDMVKVSVITVETATETGGGGNVGSRGGLGALGQNINRGPGEGSLAEINANFSESKRFSAAAIAEGMTVGAVL